MPLMQFIPGSAEVNALPAEELAAVVLRDLNRLADNDRSRDPPTISLGNYCVGESDSYGRIGQPACAHALSAAWSHLVASGMLAPGPYNSSYGWYFLTPRARAIKSDADYQHFRQVSLYPVNAIHSVIREETYAEFLRGDYETAVFKALKAVEVAVRPYTTAPANVVGRDLMVKAFHSETGTLRDPSEPTAERESLMELFRGAVGRFKNPTSHREVDFGEPAEVIEILQLASLLMRIVERRGAARQS